MFSFPIGNENDVLKSQITQRVSFAESPGTGQTVLETEPNGQASQEIKAVVNELMELQNHG